MTHSTMGVSVDESRCIGAGNCILTAPDVFDQREEDGIAVVLDRNPPPGRAAVVAQAAQLCPAAAIAVTSA